MIGSRPLSIALFMMLATASCTDVHPSVLAAAETAEDGHLAGPTATAEAQSEGAGGTEESADGAPLDPTEPRPAVDEPVPSTDVEGTVVSAATGAPLAGAHVSVGDVAALTGNDGAFALREVAADGSLVVERAAWEPVTLELADHAEPGDALTVELEPKVMRGIRVSRAAAANPALFAGLLGIAEATTVNTLVFDTKDETSDVLYDTDVAFAHEIGAVNPTYDPARLIARAKEAGLYTITRVVTFEDSIWAAADSEAKLAGAWVDAGNPDNWRYPIDLAVEACRLGFNEVQFDYVRFPSGRTAEVAINLVPQTESGRSAAIADFLAEARAELATEGCAVSAAIFGIVMSSTTDERLGQTPETISPVVDAVSPMVYPSHYSPGWLGFADPNDHPGPVVAFSLDEGTPRVSADTVVRPWLQGFGYTAEQVRAQIDEADSRGAGWIIWNASGRYDETWFPPS